jgi:hypothetical protein
MKRAAGLIVFTHLPGKGLVAILQKRGEFNDETMLPESFPGGCQLTVWGSVKDDEDYAAALNREIGEETGWVWLADFLIARNEGKAIHLEEPSSSGAASVWAAYFPAEKIKQLRLSAASGGIVLLEEKDLVRIHDLKRDFDRSEGVPMRGTIAMFSDSREMLAKGFVWAGTVNPES